MNGTKCCKFVALGIGCTKREAVDDFHGSTAAYSPNAVGLVGWFVARGSNSGRLTQDKGGSIHAISTASGIHWVGCTDVNRGRARFLLQRGHVA